MALNTRILAEQLNISANTMLVEVERLNSKYQLGITSSELTRNQYDVLRSLLDPDYLVKRMLDTESDTKYNFTSNPDHTLLLEWIPDNNLNGCSTKDIKHMLPDHIESRGHQIISSAMRKAGYTSKVVVLDSGKQGRRWFNKTQPEQDTPSFF